MQFRTVDGQVVAHFTLDDGEVLQVTVTDEGVIFDGYRGEDHVGTRGMTAAEWFASLTGQQ